MTATEVKRDHATVRAYLALVRRWQGTRPPTTRRDAFGRRVIAERIRP